MITTTLEEKGYIVIHNFFSPKQMQELLSCIVTLAETIYKREFNNRMTPGKASVELLDKYVMGLFEKDKNLVGELYDAFAYSTVFLRFISRIDIEMIINKLLGQPHDAPLYAFTNRCRIDPPHDTRRTYGWHQEVFYTIPNGEFLQTWAPLFRNTTIQNGTIELAEGSHKSIAPQSWNEQEGKATQIIVDQNEVDKFKQIQLEMNVCDLLIFTGKTMHRSGYNSSNEVRYSLVGMYHTGMNTKVNWPKPDFKLRGQSSEEYFQEKKLNKWQ